MLSEFGMPAVLRSTANGDRPCTVFLSDWTVQELYGRQYDPVSRKALVSPAGLTYPPNMLERLVTFVQPMAEPPVENETLRILLPPTQVGPAGVTLIWELVVRA